MWCERNNYPYIFKCKCVFMPSIDDINFIFIQSVFNMFIHLLHNGDVLCFIVTYVHYSFIPYPLFWLISLFPFSRISVHSFLK